MLSGVNHASSTSAANQPTASARQPAPQTKSQPTATDTVTLSPPAQLQQELSETPTQTAQEARQGDTQAKKLQAQEEAVQRNGL
jgi:hypothetical protein